MINSTEVRPAVLWMAGVALSTVGLGWLFVAEPGYPRFASALLLLVGIDSIVAAWCKLRFSDLQERRRRPSVNRGALR